MRTGLISDVHANLFALRSVLEFLARRGVDMILCAGDLVGYGPHPNECVELIAECGISCVAGNHDLIAVGRLSADACVPMARSSLRWTRGVLRPDTKSYLEALPLRLEVADVVVAHGALDDPQEYVRSDRSARGQLAQLAREYPVASTLVLGHTHVQWVFVEGEGTRSAPGSGHVALGRGSRNLLNPGAVGQSRQLEWRPQARVMVLDQRLGRVECEAVGYDDRACRAALRRAGLPRESVHIWPGTAPRHARKAKRLMRSMT